MLTGRPEWVAGLVITWRLAPDWSSIVDYRYVGEQWATSRHLEDGLTEELESYNRVDWGLQWPPDERWQLQLSLDNAFNESYETAIGFEAPDRAVRLGVRYSR